MTKDTPLLCKNCGRVLEWDRAIWLEQWEETGAYYHVLPSDPMPEAESLGKYPFGPDCAKKLGRIYRSNNPAHLIIYREGKYKIESVYNTRFISYRRVAPGSWKTLKNGINEAEAREGIEADKKRVGSK